LPDANKAVIGFLARNDEAYPNKSSVEIVKQELFLDWSPDYRDHTALLQRLAGGNVARGGPSGHRNIAVIVRDPGTGEAVSGVWGTILYSWLFIDLLHVDEPDRLQGLGSRLLIAVENAARENGCVGSWLTIYAFQPFVFCEKNKYERFGELGSAPAPGSAADQRIFFYRKSFGR
jgi:GNAT superfamily N-acetyltransferase